MPERPRTGQVLAERYEVLRPAGEGFLSVDLLAFDQEREEQVLLRLLRTDGLAAPGEWRRVLSRLRAEVGAGGRFLAPLLDADRDGPHLFVVEPAPRGVSWQQVFDQRVAAGGRFEAEELLPLAARLQAALDALPAGRCHGSVRAAEVYVEEEGLRLHGAWLGGALSPGSLRALVEMSEEADLPVPPEVREGVRVGPPADRFALGAMLWSAWTGRFPDAEGLPPLGRDPVARAIAPLLHPDPEQRPDSIRDVLETLAEQAELPVPELDPGAVVPVGSDPFPSQPSGDRAEGRASSVWVRQVSGAAPGGTVELSLEDAIEESADPAVRRPPGGDPSGTAEVSLDQIVEVRDEGAVGRAGVAASSGPDAPARRQRRREPTAELSLEEAELIGGMVSSEQGGGVVVAGAAASLPEGLKPVPRPRRDSGVGMRAPPLYDEARGAAVVAPPARPYEPAAPTAPPEGEPAASRHRTARPSGRRMSSSSGWLVVAVAGFVASAIVVGALAVVAWRRAERERERERWIRERIEQVRQGR